jgi:prophage regulatory protein
MMTKQTTLLRIERKPEVLDRAGFSASTLHTRINQGLFVPPVSLGERAVGWPSHEVSQIIAALVAGKSKEDISQLVSDLVVKRSDLMEVLHG